MKIVKSVSAMILLIAMFISIDLGLNCLALAVPELQDGIGYHSVLQSTLGLLENTGIESRANFFDAFRTSIWITFSIFMANTVLYIVSIRKKKIV
ncbi:MAG: hypothetical protein PWP24_1825 [Clostridiales bacterium]|nr:hypothetical protein [Clostridiales bacterium]